MNDSTKKIDYPFLDKNFWVKDAARKMTDKVMGTKDDPNSLTSLISRSVDKVFKDIKIK